jgi:serine/threonine-protein kinase
MSRGAKEITDELDPIAFEDPGAEGPRYTSQAFLGKGAMGEVHVAHDNALARKVAFKQMAPKAAKNHDMAMRFLREMQVTAQLDHPNVVPVYAHEPAPDGSPGYAMKLVRGRTLTDVIEKAARGLEKRTEQQEQRLLAERLEIFLRICDAIAYAHAKGVLHRDLKPDNVMIGQYNEVYVMDWGICRVRGVVDGGAEAVQLSEDDATRTQMGLVVGTPAYMSPEQATGDNDRLDGRSDQFTLGLILYELVSLKRARKPGAVRETIARAAKGERAPLEHLNPGLDIPRELRAIIDKASAFNREARYATVQALADDVRRFLRGEAVQAQRDTPLQSALRWVGRHKQATLTTLLGVLCLGAGLTIFALVSGERRTAAEHQRAQHVAEFTSRVDEQAHAIDTEFQRIAGLVRALAGRADALLSHSEGAPRRIYMTADFDAGRGPPDVRPSEVHKLPMSTDFPAFKLSPGVERASVQRDLAALSQLAPAYRDTIRAILPGEGEGIDDDKLRELVADTPLPILRLFVSLENGVHQVFPGLGGFPPEYDGRLRPKYTLAANKRGVLFGNPYPDHLAARDLLPASAAIYDESGRFVGVAGLDVTFDDLRAHWMALKGQPGFEESYLVDKDNRIVVRTKPKKVEEEGGLHGNAALEREEVPFPELRKALSSKRSGTVEIKVKSGRAKLAGFTPITATGWRYVAIADLDRALTQP